MRRFLQLTLLLPCVSLDNSTNVRGGDQSAGWMNFPSSLVPSQMNDNEGVNLTVLGTRMMTVSTWKQFENTLDCWTSPEGQWVKTLNAAVCIFRQAMSIDVSATTAIVDVAAKDRGRYITPTINPNTKSGGTFSRDSSMCFFFSNPINSKHPDAISQNLVGIRKYAADCFIG